MFEGSCVALVSPMTAEDEIDEKAFAELVEWHIAEGTQALVIAGTTGESPTLTSAEQTKMFALALKLANKRIPIIAGTGTNATRSTIAKTQAAQELGVDACLVVTPYYNRPTQEGLLAHFREVAKASNAPLILYNVPTRTACDLLPETIATLSEIPNIIGIKEASGNLEKMRILKEKCRADFKFYSGDDASCWEFIKLGGHGVISITANIAPRKMQEFCRFALASENSAAYQLEKELATLHRLLVIEPNPIPVKWALHAMGKISPTLRLPLTPLSVAYQQDLKDSLISIGIL